MGYGMKYTNGKKADPAKFPFKETRTERVTPDSESPAPFIDLTKGARDKVAMAATGGMLGDESKGTDRDSLMGKN